MALPINLSNIRQQFSKMLFNSPASIYFEPILDKYFPQLSWLNIKAKVVSIVQEKEDVLSITLKPSTKWKGFIAGQFIQIGIKINGVIYNRTFSISSSVFEFDVSKTITISVQKQEKGKVTNWMFNNLKENDFIIISPANGSFILPRGNNKILLIAGGTGITPFKSILYQCVKVKKNVVILYYAKTNKHLFKEEFESFTKSNNIDIHFISSDKNGRISQNHVETFCPDFIERKVLVCGPNTMIKDTNQLLIENKVSEKNITYEYFTPLEYKSIENLKENKFAIKTNSATVEGFGDKSILEQLESKGIYPAYGCRMGLCKQCQCTKKEGVIYNKQTNKFSESGEELIQICVSVAVGEVKINL